MAIIANGKHTAKRPSRWRRKLGVPVFAWVFFATALTALAVFAVLRTTQTSTLSASSAGNVLIGDAETVALFDITGMETGQTEVACMVAEVDQRGLAASDGLSLYADSVGGTGLAAYLDLTIEVGDSTNGTTGIRDCGTWTPGTLSVVHSGTTLDAYAAAKFDYATGDILRTVGANTLQQVPVKFTLTLPDNPTTNQNAGGLSASAAWTFENRGG